MQSHNRTVFVLCTQGATSRIIETVRKCRPDLKDHPDDGWKHIYELAPDEFRIEAWDLVVFEDGYYLDGGLMMLYMSLGVEFIECQDTTILSSSGPAYVKYSGPIAEQLARKKGSHLRLVSSVA